LAEVNHAVQHVHRRLTARHRNLPDEHVPQFLERDLNRRRGLYAGADKLVDSSLPPVPPPEVEIQSFYVPGIIDPDEYRAIVRIREGRD
jgi:hypothetical protein